MRFLQTPLGAAAGAVLLAVLLVFGFAAIRINGATHPQRSDQEPFDLESILFPVDEVEFSAVDGLPLSGWLVRGGTQRPPLILAHDLGDAKVNLLPLADRLVQSGFTCLLFDFRGHGDSHGNSSTLGLDEKRDILGALEYLRNRPGVEARRVGVFGVGMGAHAAVLAAEDAPALKVLVLDGLYPDAGFPLARHLYADWEFGRRHLSFVPRSVFAVMHRRAVGSASAADTLSRMLGRDVLLMAPDRDPLLAGSMKAMYQAIPEQMDVDGNLVTVPASLGDGLYGERLDGYQQRVAQFFLSRLRVRQRVVLEDAS